MDTAAVAPAAMSEKTICVHFLSIVILRGNGDQSLVGTAAATAPSTVPNAVKIPPMIASITFTSVFQFVVFLQGYYIEAEV